MVAGVLLAPLFAAVAWSGLKPITTAGLAFLGGGIVGAVVAPADAIDHRSRFATVFPGAALLVLGTGGLVLVACAWLTFELVGPTAAAALFAVGVSVLLYGFGGAVGAWVITARLQAAQHIRNDAQQR